MHSGIVKSTVDIKIELEGRFFILELVELGLKRFPIHSSMNDELSTHGEEKFSLDSYQIKLKLQQSYHIDRNLAVSSIQLFLIHL